MPDVIGVRFKPSGKIYSFKANGVSAKPGMWVVVDSEMGQILGLVVTSQQPGDRSDKKMKKVVRLATVEDLQADRENRSLEREAMNYCAEKVKSHNLFMKVVRTESTLDRKRLIFYFTAEGRIDFRRLVRDLASKFKTRIEMRQIGVRDEVKCLGGIGCCGREVCCKVFLTSFEPISIRMAKQQELTLNPGKLSGICGRLMCCLGYEIHSKGLKTPKTDAAAAAPSEKGLPETKTEKPAAPKQPAQKAAKKPVTAKPPEKPPARPQEQEQKKAAERKDRGKPFSRRKKFRKKKKRRDG